MTTNFPSTFDIGDPVYLLLGGYEIKGHVQTVTFATGKVLYAVAVLINTGKRVTTLHNLDSILVIPRADGVKVVFSNMDNC